jgi:hypothetical protein
MSFGAFAVCLCVICYAYSVWVIHERRRLP